MNIPLYVFHEIIIRLQELNPDIGDFSHYRTINNGKLLRTTVGEMMIEDSLLLRQFESPESITPTELLSLLNSFHPIS